MGVVNRTGHAYVQRDTQERHVQNVKLAFSGLIARKPVRRQGLAQAMDDVVRREIVFAVLDQVVHRVSSVPKVSMGMHVKCSAHHHQRAAGMGYALQVGNAFVKKDGVVRTASRLTVQQGTLVIGVMWDVLALSRALIMGDVRWTEGVNAKFLLQGEYAMSAREMRLGRIVNRHATLPQHAQAGEGALDRTWLRT
jgi:hypothetical protein